VSVEQRAESGEQSLENGEHKFLVQILTENVCITVGLGGITSFFFLKREPNSVEVDIN
jgi:hypothetical protein